MSSVLEIPSWLQRYEERMPSFTEKLRQTIHVPPTHPMYQDYYRYAFWRFEQGRALVELLGSMLSLKDATVLDIGSGVGGVSARMAEAGAKVCAMDVAWGFLNLSRSAYSDLGVTPLSLFASGERIPLRSASCDLILAMDILEHVPRPQDLFDEVARCLKPGGLVCLQTGYRYDWKNIRRDPHYGLPLVVLLPRWLRELVVVRWTRRNPELEDYYWFKSYGEVFDCFARRGIVLHREADVVIGGRLERSEVVLGEAGDRLHLDGDPARGEGFWGRESHDGVPMRWSRRRAIIRLRRGQEHRSLHLRFASLDPQLGRRPQAVEVRVDGRRAGRFELRDHRWFDCTIPLRDHVLRGGTQTALCAVELSVHPTWSPRDHGIEDGRELGVAVHSAALR